MEFAFDSDAQGRLTDYFDGVGEILKNKKRRASFATYAMGLIGDGDRKSIEPIAARASGDPKEADALHQRLQHFLVDSAWSDREVRRHAAKHTISEMVGRETVTDWIVDDTGFLKQGKHSVGVQRQYTGSAGKVTNCQIGVSLSVATPTEHLPIDFELYLPHSWADDPARRAEARIPDDVTFKTKLELALDMIRRAVSDEVPPGLVSVDTAYGNSSAFRREIRKLDLDYAVAVRSTTKVRRLDKLERRRGRPLTVLEMAEEIAACGGFRRTTWREGTNGKMSARFAMRRVLPLCDDRKRRDEREVVWLLMEWEDGEAKPTKFYFATLPKNITKKKLVRRIKQRWRTERAYQDLKGQLGLDHFEGRRYPGWHHHVSVALCCYAFVTAERLRRFSPQSRGPHRNNAELLAT